MSCHLGDATLLGERGVLLVTAHPDDEAMFFVPTILALQARGVVVHVLCLSTGDVTLGAVRSPSSCAAARASTSLPSASRSSTTRGCATDPTRFGILRWWRRSCDASCGSTRWRRSSPSTHTASRAIRITRRCTAAWPRSPLAGAPRAYELVSTGLVRKHSGVVDVGVSAAVGHLLDGRCCFVSAEPWRCHAAMRCHASQYVWFRRLYVLTSRYVFCNTLRPIVR